MHGHCPTARRLIEVAVTPPYSCTTLNPLTPAFKNAIQVPELVTCTGAFGGQTESVNLSLTAIGEKQLNPLYCNSSCTDKMQNNTLGH